MGGSDQSTTAGEGFARLLGALDPDPARAEVALRHLLGKLVVLFERRGLPDAEDLALEVISRVARAYSQGRLPTENTHSFCYAVARNVMFEARRTRREEQFPSEMPEPRSELEESIWQQKRSLEEALSILSPAERDLLVSYYDGDQSGRQALAERLKITPNHLRVRLHLIRSKIIQLLKRQAVGNEPR